MKSYQERRLALAEEFARAEWRRIMANEKFDWDRNYLTDSDKRQRIDNMLPQARIALKHMAEEWRDGYFKGAMDMASDIRPDKTLSTQLQSLGLIEPQTT